MIAPITETVKKAAEACLNITAFVTFFSVILGFIQYLIKDNYVSSFFYYRLTNEENINDIIKKFNISLDDFYRYNKKSEYKENSLIRIKKHEK